MIPFYFMLKLLLIILYSLNLYGAISTGTGVDGACDETTIQNADTSPYNCTTLATAGNITITGTNNLTIYVQGEVQISHTITISGDNGVAGPDDESQVMGGTAGSGGGDGGYSWAAMADIQSGSGNAPGLLGGDSVVDVGDDGTAQGAGGGGAGGSNDTIGGQGSNGQSIFTHIDSATGIGGNTSGTLLNPSLLLNLVPSIPGGSGGGAGGIGSQWAGNVGAGGSGAGGGGSITIIAGGNIILDATGIINASGGTGGTGWSSGADIGPGGSGGSGSGGTIFLYSKLQIINDGYLLAIGGSMIAGKTETAATSGSGGQGGKGIIRLDDFGGLISGSGTTNPAAYIFSSKPLFESDEIGFYCGTTQSNPPTPPWHQLLTIFAIMFSTIGCQRLFAKLKWPQP